MGTESPVVDMLHVGHREYYIIPKMLQELGFLRNMYTDTYTGPGSWMFCLRPFLNVVRGSAASSLLARASELPAKHVKCHNRLGILAKKKLGEAKSTFERMEIHHWLQNSLTDEILKTMKMPPDVMCSFRGCDRLFEQLSGSSKCLLDQIDGAMHEVDIVREEQRKNIEWVEGKADWMLSEETGEKFWMDIEGPRLRREWHYADRILCNSNWTVECLTRAGVPSDKCVVVPLAFQPSMEHSIPTPVARNTGSLVVGFLGTLTLRKGIHILLEAAHLARGACDVRVICAGASEINLNMLDRYDFVDYRGCISRESLPAFFQSIDVLVLPSVSEGFGIVQLEAMSHGIPVLASDRTGEVVVHDVNGLVHQATNIEELAQQLVEVASLPGKLHDLGRAALSRCRDFSYHEAIKKWKKVILSLM